MNTIKVILTVVFILLYFWSSKIIDTQDLIGIKKYSDGDISGIADRVLDHTETTTNWVFDSGVCLAGKIVFFLWTFVLLINLFMPLNKKLLMFLAFLTIVITTLLNMPLFIRSIPAFIILLIICVM